MFMDSPGIRPRIRPAASENARMNASSSLKEAVMRPARTLSAQQRRFDAFVEKFNWPFAMKPWGV